MRPGNGSAPLALTMGDPAGIGPEIVAKAIARGEGDAHGGGTVLVGDPATMERAFGEHAPAWTLREVEGPGRLRSGDAAPGGRTVPLVAAGRLDAALAPGQVSAAAGGAAFAAIERAIELARDGAVAGIVTAPIHKEALAAAGVPFPGHTEMLDALGFDRMSGDASPDRATRVAMMLANDELRVVLVTIHCALGEAVRRITHETEMKAIRLAHEGGRALGLEAPRVAVAGLNPHAGEGGLFGSEEIEVIAPAIRAARDEGIDASGPWPGDTVFMRARAGEFDVVVAQYHDQGLIPVKYLGLDEGVNVTLGLPFVRTSPDHGTAFDLAGRGVANPESMIRAIRLARRLVAARGGSAQPSSGERPET